jgi:hypothetical protein
MTRKIEHATGMTQQLRRTFCVMERAEDEDITGPFLMKWGSQEWWPEGRDRYSSF